MISQYFKHQIFYFGFYFHRKPTYCFTVSVLEPSSRHHKNVFFQMRNALQASAAQAYLLIYPFQFQMHSYLCSHIQQVIQALSGQIGRNGEKVSYTIERLAISPIQKKSRNNQPSMTYRVDLLKNFFEKFKNHASKIQMIFQHFDSIFSNSDNVLCYPSV